MLRFFLFSFVDIFLELGVVVVVDFEFAFVRTVGLIISAGTLFNAVTAVATSFGEIHVGFNFDFARADELINLEVRFA
jgi:hypothetical protein